MSEWYEAKDEDIDLDENSDEVNILVTHNDFGNVYVTLTFEQVEKLDTKIRELNDNPHRQ